EPQPVQPSAFDEESTMTPAQLLNRWDGTVTEASRRFHVPKAWIRAVMQRESGGRTMLGQDRPMVSSAGALGLMQVLPGTYDEMRAQYRLGANPFDAHDNILAGAAYLNWLHHKYGYPAMFAAYNAGPGRLEDHLAHGATLPAETRAYIAGITRKLDGKSRGTEMVNLTRPDGAAVKIDPGQVIGIRAALPGEYADSVKTVITLGKHRQQGIREDVAAATTAIRDAGLI
ncbi:MAG TPA: lytic transglycosylase domain-containing protein, partial [Rhizomicrobium sp.]